MTWKIERGNGAQADFIDIRLWIKPPKTKKAARGRLTKVSEKES